MSDFTCPMCNEGELMQFIENGETYFLCDTCDDRFEYLKADYTERFNDA